MLVNDRLVAFARLWLLVADRCQPLLGPLTKQLLSAARVDPVATEQIGLNRVYEMLRIDLARGRSYIGTINLTGKPDGSGTKFDRSGRIIGQSEGWKDGKSE